MTTQQKVFIGGAGWQPLMNTLVPKTATIGNIFTLDAAIETPTKKYTVHFKINMERDTLISDLEKTASSARIERICGASIVDGEPQTVFEEINGQLMECKTSPATFKADDDAEPTSGHINAVSLLGFGEVFATVDVSDLTDEKLLANQNALNISSAEQLSEPKESDIVYDPSARAATWRKITAQFSPDQNKAFGILFDAYQKGNPSVHNKEILEALTKEDVDSDGKTIRKASYPMRMVDIFKGCQLWKTLIVQSKKRGWWELNPSPDN